MRRNFVVSQKIFGNITYNQYIFACIANIDMVSLMYSHLSDASMPTRIILGVTDWSVSSSNVAMTENGCIRFVCEGKVVSSMSVKARLHPLCL